MGNGMRSSMFQLTVPQSPDYKLHSRDHEDRICKPLSPPEPSPAYLHVGHAVVETYDLAIEPSRTGISADKKGGVRGWMYLLDPAPGKHSLGNSP